MSARSVVFLLAALLGLQPMTTDLYLPALPALTAQLQATVAQTQSTFTAMLLAFGGSQLLWGAASDRWGRRPILLSGLACYAVAAVGCALAQDMPSLIALRAVQGAALGASVMAARAIVRDLYNPVQGAHTMSQALTGLGILACSSPLIGSWLTTQFGWRATMLMLALAGLSIWLLVWKCFRETIPQRNPAATQPRLLWRTWRSIVAHPTFLAYTATTSFSYAGLVVFLTGAPFTFMTVLGWSASEVGLLLAANGVTYMLGTWVCRRLLPRWGVRHTVAIAAGIGSLCALLLLLIGTGDRPSSWALALACLVFPFAHGIQQPCGQSGAVSSFPHAAGTASALNGFGMMLVAFATGQVLGRHFNGTVYPLVFGMAFWCLATALASWTLVRRYGAPQSA